ncbi:MAG: tryptophan synthase subunit alpha, partial [Saprospiraceae bacterium]|nr:tryptophan synthase subunit alpha [Saprospiraceae bacterium]
DEFASPTIDWIWDSNAETFQTACNHSNGAIIGSAFIKMLSNSTQLKEDIINFVKDIKR